MSRRTQRTKNEQADLSNHKQSEGIQGRQIAPCMVKHLAIVTKAASQMPSSLRSMTKCDRSPSGITSHSVWDDFGYVAHAAQMTNSSSPPPPKISGNWRRSFLHRSKRERPDQKGARTPFDALLSAPATRCFSTEPADSRPSSHQPGSLLRTFQN